MKVSFHWLKEFIHIPDDIEKIAQILTEIGHEVEAVERYEDDVVLEINITPNRPDCLSVFGIARELSAYYGVPIKFPEYNFTPDVIDLNFNVSIFDPDLCNRYAGRIVKNVKISTSPEWMRQRLEKSGIRSINNVVDVTNYVLLELGHPLHAFDLNSLKGNMIRVGTPKTILGRAGKIKTKTLDGVERQVSDDALLIWDSEEPIAIAGVMGGLNTEVTENTKDIFIESAHFNPISIRRTSKNLGLKTESSYRFERGCDIKLLKKALDRCAFLIKNIAGGQIFGKIDIYPKIFQPTEINLRYEKVNTVLGLNLSKEDIDIYLKNLSFEVESDDERVKVRPPSYRNDIKREIDIIEEIARLYGYDKIPTNMPFASIGIDDQVSRQLSLQNSFRERIRNTLLNYGFNETINFSFMSHQDLDLLKIPQEDPRRKTVNILNPLRVEDSCMRTTLIPSLLKNVIFNVSHGNRDLRFFEISRIFLNENSSKEQVKDRLPVEIVNVGVINYKEKVKTLYKEESHDFYLMKGVVEALLNACKIKDCVFVRTTEPFLHPGQSADIYISNSKIGFLGVLLPTIINDCGIKTQKPSISLFELDLGKLFKYHTVDIRYRPFSKYPYIERDTAIVVDSNLEAITFQNLIKQYPTDLIEEISLFDIYQGANIPPNKKSVAFRIRYRALDRTLKDEEVDTLHSQLVSFILEKTKGQIRM
ncbi:MAG: phenylalanine--tRNA ligase subunit beta [Thermodesulfovibrionales bacterium]|nr:phenylalanine--tRNA ligase subunit beta [Thermodesulfovibrionales bacterium]